MSGHRRKLLPLCIAASLLTGISAEVAAVGVGEIHLQSFLGAPLQAEVPLNHMGDLSSDQLKIQIGSQSDYSALGVEYIYLHSQLKIEPVIKNGQGYVRITTREPITEPYLNFVLNLHWPQGQLVREFTVLLDPAPAKPVASAVVQPTVEAQPAAVLDTIAAQELPAAPKRHRQRSITAPAHQVPTPSAPTEGTYLTQRGDSLWRIANKVRPAQVPVEQAMSTILALNPGAFINGNPALLKEAATITVPSAAQIAAATGTTLPVVADNAVGTNRAAAAPAESKGGAAVEQLAEENSALKTQVGDLTGNVATLNQNLIQSEQRLHQLEAQLNELLQQMQQQRATVAALSGTADSHSAPTALSSGSMISQVNASELVVAPKPHTPWWVHMLYWLGIGGAVTWAVREHFWPQRRLALAYGGSTSFNDGNLAFDDSNDALRSEPAARLAVNEPRAFAPVPLSSPELTLDAGDLPDPAAIAEPAGDTPAPQLLKSGDEPVDASISAGVFVAFGRFEEAERLLRDAIERDSVRIDLKLQLLDVFMQTDQPGAFDDLAADIERAAATPEILAELAVLRDSYRPRH